MVYYGRVQNLIYSSQADRYRFRPDNEYSQPDKDTEYWNWMAATPTGSSSDNTDACSKVYPEGMWRMPTSTNSVIWDNLMIKKKIMDYS
jgi:hypothetical protein